MPTEPDDDDEPRMLITGDHAIAFIRQQMTVGMTWEEARERALAIIQSERHRRQRRLN